MDITKCPNGHYYDRFVYASCPICAQSNAETHTDERFRDLRLLKGCTAAPEFIASGSTCDVYRVEKDGKSYALKVLDCGTNTEKQLNAKMEISVMRRVAHCKNVVRLIDSETRQQEDRNTVFLLEEYMTPFEQYWKAAPMAVGDVIRLGADICQALAECWDAGVAHLDVQPKNLFVREDGTFCLGDFGSALPQDLLELFTSQLRGTPSYMAPEVKHDQSYSQASDIYSLGIILYCLLHGGTLPFADKYPKEEAIQKRMSGEPVTLSAECPAPLAQCIRKACAFRPGDRYRTFRELHVELRALLPLRAERPAATGSARPEAQAPMPAPPAPSSPACAPAPQKSRSRIWNPFSGLSSRRTKSAPSPASSPAPAPVRMPAPPAPSSPAPAPVRMPAPTGNLFDSDPLATSCALFPSSREEGTQTAGSVFGPTLPAASYGPTGFGATPTVPAPPTAPMAAVPTAPVAAVPTAPVAAAPTVPIMGQTIPVSSASPFAAAPGCAAPPAPPAPQTNASMSAGNLFDSDPTATTCSLLPTAPVAGQAASVRPEPDTAPRMDQVQFSAIAPKEAVIGDYSLIQIYMYEQLYRSVVQEAIDTADTPVQEKRSGFHQVRRNTRVRIVLTSPDMDILDNELTQIWTGGYLNFYFAVCPLEGLRKRQMLLNAAVYFDDVPATRLMLTIKPAASPEEQVEITRQDIVTAFVSYASQDRSRVGLLVRGMQKARPDMDIFFDVISLRSGENWRSALFREIDKRDLLFLCWSRSAQDSPWVDKEWRYALEHKGVDAIEPIPLDPPDICPPPIELSDKHFNDSLLFALGR